MWKRLKSLFGAGGEQSGPQKESPSESPAEVSPGADYARELERPSARENDAPPQDRPQTPPQFPFEVIAVTASEAQDLLDKATREPGVVPVILGDDDERLSEIAGCAAEAPPLLEILSEAERIDVDAWMRSRRAESGRDCDSELVENPNEPDPQMAPYTLDSCGERVYVAMIRVAEPWQVMGVLKMGGWNDCPAPEEHVAIAKRWYEKYGAVVCCCAGDVIEYHVERSPATREECDALSLEHIAYSSDMDESLATHSVSLPGSKYWFFWWD